MIEDPRQVRELMELGVSAYILKSASALECPQAEDAIFGEMQARQGVDYRRNSSLAPQSHRSRRSGSLGCDFPAYLSAFSGRIPTGRHRFTSGRAPVLGANFTGDRRSVRSDREGSGRALRLVYAVL
jgi:hypothetical protein